MKYPKLLFFSLILIVVFLSGCQVEVGKECFDGFINHSCVTGKCIDNICSKSNLFEPCKSTSHCVQGTCVLGYCRETGKLGDTCEYDLHCKQGVCKDYKCQLGTKGDSCTENNDCNSGFECMNSHCVSSGFFCKVARYFKLNELGAGWGFFLLILGIFGAVTGFTLPGLTVSFKGINIILSIAALGAGLIVLSAGIWGACF